MGTAPTDLTIGWYFKTGGNPTNDTDAMTGDPDFTTPITPATNNFISNPTITGSPNSYRGIGARRQEATGTLLNARITNRCGGIVPASSGLFTVVSTSNADTGPLWIAYKFASAWTVEDLAMTGTSPVTGANSWDAHTPWMALYEPLAAPTGNFRLQVAGQDIGVIFGTDDNPGDGTDISTWQCSSLYDMALATALNTAIEADNRKTDPASGISAFTQGSRWSGADNSLSVPGGTMILNDWIDMIGRLNLPGGFPKPPGGKIRFFPDLIGDPSNT